jgi:hypothetical protein
MGQWIRANVKGDEAAWKRLGDDPDAEAAFAVLTAAFELAVRRRFTPGQDVRDISRFVGGMKDRFALDMVRHIDAEALIRAALGEDVSTDGIEMVAESHARQFTIVEVVEQLNLSDRDLDALLAEAEQMAVARGFNPVAAGL